MNSTRQQPINPYPIWCPRFWHGMRTGSWVRLLLKNRCRVDMNRASMIFGISAITPINDMLALIQRLFYERSIRQTQIKEPPVFIVGHWRSGTTLLHELLVTDPQFACPNTYQCFAPSHFLVSEYLMVRLGGFLVPKRRPMDNMSTGWLHPQEDEFALMNLGVPSPYLQVAFPRTQPKLLNYLDMQGLSEEELREWKDAFHWFLQAVTYRYGGRRLILKSPTHTGRIGLLHQTYPGSKFIHLVRSPEQLHLSTRRLWKSLQQVQALHAPMHDEDINRYVVECYRRMYEQFERDRAAYPDLEIVDIRYEDLIADPKGTIRHLYESLQLGDFDDVSERLDERLKDFDKYQPNRYPLNPEERALIRQIWYDYSLRYGYQPEASALEATAPRSA